MAKSKKETIDRTHKAFGAVKKALEDSKLTYLEMLGVLRYAEQSIFWEIESIQANYDVNYNEGDVSITPKKEDKPDYSYFG